MHHSALISTYDKLCAMNYEIENSFFWQVHVQLYNKSSKKHSITKLCGIIMKDMGKSVSLEPKETYQAANGTAWIVALRIRYIRRGHVLSNIQNAVSNCICTAWLIPFLPLSCANFQNQGTLVLSGLADASWHRTKSCLFLLYLLWPIIKFIPTNEFNCYQNKLQWCCTLF